MYRYATGANSHCEILLADDIRARWSELCEYLSQAIPYFYSYVDLDFYYRALTEDTESPFRLWTVYLADQLKAVFITRLEMIGGKRVFTYELIGAQDFDIWATELIQEFENTLAKELDIDQFRVVGRPGWQKKMKKYGYEYSYIICIREAQ